MKVLLKYTLIFFMTILVLVAVIISLARYFMPSVDQYEQQITDLVAKELQLDVQFGTFTGDWYRLGPAIKITDIVLSTHTGQIITEIDALYISFNLLASITERKLVPAYLNVIGLNLDLVQNPDKSLTIANLPSKETTSSDHHVLLDALKKYNKITIRRSQISFTDYAGKQTPLYLRRMVLSRAGQSHQLDVMLNLLNHPTRLEMMTTITGDLAKPENLAVNGYVKVDNAVLDGYMKPYAFKGYTLVDGLVDLDAWVDWREGQLQSLQAQVNLQQTQIHAAQHNTDLKPFDMQGAFLWKREGEHAWTLSSNELLLGIDDLDLMPLFNKFKLTQTGQEQQFVVDKIMLGNLTQALLWSEELPQDQHQLLTELMPQGDIENVQMNWHKENWQLGLRFNALSYQRWNDIPGAENLTGELMATKAAGKISLSSANTRIDYTALFPYPFLFSQITGDVTWQHSGDLWQVKSDRITLVNNELQIDSDFIVKGGTSIDTHVDANMVIPQLNSANLYHYLPVGELSSDLAQWLKTSIGQGQLDHLTLKTYGPFKDFPYYDQGDGIFRFHMNMQDLDLTFDPDWPKLENVSGQLLFSGRNIEIALDKAQMFQTELLSVAADIHLPPEGTSWLKIHGEVVTPVQHGIDFINATPLSKTLGKNLDLATFNMPATLTLDLNIPLDSENQDTKVNGFVQISEGDATLKDFQLQFSNVHGVFGFTENSVFSDGINTQLFGKPALLTMTPQMKGTHHITHWQLTGVAKTTDLALLFPNPIWDYAQGESEFVASFEIDNDANQKGFDLSIASELKGTAINLPKPLTKTKDEIVAVRYTTSISKPDTVMRLQYTKLIDGVLQFSPQGEKSVLTGGKIQLGGPLTNFEIPKGIVVTGHLNDLSYDVWDDFFDSLKTTQSENNFKQHIKQVNVNVDRFEAFHYPLTKAQLNLTQAQNQWLLNVNSQELKGQVTIPQLANSGPIALNFDYCNWHNTEHTEEKNPMDPRLIPALTFRCNDFVYDQKKLGTIKFNVEPEALGLKLSQVEMTRANDKITASGRWWIENEVQNTRFTGHLQSNALDKTLALADVKSSILGSKTNIDFNLAWPGDPFDFALAHLNGDLDIHLSKGVLVDVNPGFGRILSLLSIGSLERRLRLDFSDVFKKGFSFDDITALVTIKNGIAHSDNLMMKAPAAEVKMKGDVNLDTKQLNLVANLTTHITSSLPIAATIASGGNPIVGAIGVGVWAADKIVKSQAGDMLGSTYHVTGTWEKPIVNGK